MIKRKEPEADFWDQECQQLWRVVSVKYIVETGRFH